MLFRRITPGELKFAADALQRTDLEVFEKGGTEVPLQAKACATSRPKFSDIGDDLQGRSR